MRRLSRTLSLCLFCTCVPWALAQEKAIPSGMFSRTAKVLWGQVSAGLGTLTVPSPDGLSSITARGVVRPHDDERVILDVHGIIGTRQIDLGPGVASELTWSPDSHAFFVTTSNEGANGSFHLLLYQRDRGHILGRDITSLIYAAFGHPVACGWREPPNVGGIGWTPDSQYVFVAAEIINHSNCDSFGTFKVYEVDVASYRIVSTLDQLEAKRKLARMLGTELRDAPDNCIRDPKTCYVRTNH